MKVSPGKFLKVYKLGFFALNSILFGEEITNTESKTKLLSITGPFTDLPVFDKTV